MNFIWDYTDDGLRLQGTHWDVSDKEICVVCIHGQGGNIIENYFATVWGDILSQNGIGFLYGHNRGYSYINGISSTTGKSQRIGAVFEIFEDSFYDVDLWIRQAKKLGYKKLILLGHSLGCNKIIYYLSKKETNVVDGIILASPPDMVGITLLEEPYYEDLVQEAQNNVNNGEPRKLLNQLLSGYDYVSSESFLNFYTEGNSIDNLPIERNPEHFEQLEKITVPVLAFFGSIEYPTYLKLHILKEKAINCSDFEIKIINESGHTYKHCEEETANVISNWVKTKIL